MLNQRLTARAISEAQVNVTARRNAHAREAALLADYEKQLAANMVTIEQQREKVARCQLDVEVAAERLQMAYEADTTESRLAQARAEQEQRSREAQEKRQEAELRLQRALQDVEEATAAIGAG